MSYSKKQRMKALMKRLERISEALKIKEGVEVTPLEIMNHWIQDFEGVSAQRAELDRLHFWAACVLNEQARKNMTGASECEPTPNE